MITSEQRIEQLAKQMAHVARDSGSIDIVALMDRVSYEIMYARYQKLKALTKLATFFHLGMSGVSGRVMKYRSLYGFKAWVTINPPKVVETPFYKIDHRSE